MQCSVHTLVAITIATPLPYIGGWVVNVVGWETGNPLPQPQSSKLFDSVCTHKHVTIGSENHNFLKKTAALIISFGARIKLVPNSE